MKWFVCVEVESVRELVRVMNEATLKSFDAESSLWDCVVVMWKKMSVVWDGDVKMSLELLVVMF